MNNWSESTDPRKHVFEDIAIAAFIIEYWKLNDFEPEKFEFRDLGCGNGLLVHILILEGYKGKGIDARARKSWVLYPSKSTTMSFGTNYCSTNFTRSTANVLRYHCFNLKTANIHYSRVPQKYFYYWKSFR